MPIILISFFATLFFLTMTPIYFLASFSWCIYLLCYNPCIK